MQLIKVGAAVLNQTPLDWDGNKRNILAAIAAARIDGVQLLCLPELCITGYGCEDMFHSAGVQRMALRVLREIAPATAGMAVSVGLPLLFQSTLFNTACLIVDGQVRGFVAKRYLAGEGIHYEPRWFKAWPSGLVTSTEVDAVALPLGEIFFDLGGVKVGFEICEDAWVARRPGADLALKGVDIILNPSASHFAFGKFEVRKRFVTEGSRAFGVSYVYANLLGNESGRTIYDGGALIASAGELMAVGPRLSFADFVLTSALIDLDITRGARARSGSYAPQLEAIGAQCVYVPFTFVDLKTAAKPVPQSTWEQGPDVKCEEFSRAEALALYDYLRKSRSHGYVVSISGGADSATVSCLVHLMVQLGTAELGMSGFLAKLPWLKPLQERSPRSLVQALLLTVYQATANSSKVTHDAAQGVAQAIGAEFINLELEEVAQSYRVLIEKAIGRHLSWEQDDIALQNIQARVRSPGVWMLANLRGALLLATSNRSEAAVGYATMDGDTSGGLSPLGGVDKAFIRRWLCWMEKIGPQGVGPIVALSLVNAQQPTAELRPAGSKQTDEADLMPYDILDRIERAAILDRQTPGEVFERMRVEFPHHRAADLRLWVERFFRLWCRNQWKRERYAPSFHLDDESLDPKTWCRFPILSGGFERELESLRSLVPDGAK